MIPDPRECFERVPADAVEVGDLHHGVVVVDKVVRVPRAAVGADVKIGVTTRFLSRRLLGNSVGLIQSPCSRHRIFIGVSAKLQATGRRRRPQ